MSDTTQMFGGITECMEQITACYARHDEAEQNYFRSKSQMEIHSNNVDAVYHILSFCIPATVEEACQCAAILAGDILHSRIDDEGEGRERIDRMLKNLVSGLRRLSGDDFSLPDWTYRGD